MATAEVFMGGRNQYTDGFRVEAFFCRRHENAARDENEGRTAVRPGHRDAMSELARQTRPDTAGASKAVAKKPAAPFNRASAMPDLADNAGRGRRQRTGMAAQAEYAPVTEWLARSRAGDVHARDKAYAAMYEQLRLAAHRQLHGQRQALQTTALVHEAWLKLAGNAALAPADRNHLMALSTRAMRQVLVDHARHLRADKRDGALEPLTLAAASVAQPQAEVEVLALHELLEELQGFDPRAASIVELRYFGGYEEAEIAAMLDTSLSTVQRDWRRTRAWLAAKLDN